VRLCRSSSRVVDSCFHLNEEKRSSCFLFSPERDCTSGGPSTCWISELSFTITLAGRIDQKRVQRQQRDADTTSKQPVDTVHQLDVGGHIYKVSRSLLAHYPDTMLARPVSEDWQNDDNKDGAHFIDRNGERFQYVLDSVCVTRKFICR